jgi:DNA replication protein DnaC
MKQIGGIVVSMLEFTQRQARERDREVRERVGDENIRKWIAKTHGQEVAVLFPKDFTLDDFIQTVNDASLDEAKTRLKLCATCPPHGGACASEYEQERGKAPCWDREKGLRMEWCPRWREHILRQKLTSVGVATRLLSARFSTYVPKTPKQKEALAQCQRYAVEFRRGATKSNLLIVGQHYGVGKTHLAISVVADLLSRYRLRNSMFVYVPDFLERIRRSYDEPEHRGLMDKASTTDLLVLDDLAAQRTTDWVREQLNLLSNARWSAGLPTIITTNVKPQSLIDTLGPRAESRFFGDAIGVDVDGPDMRQVP